MGHHRSHHRARTSADFSTAAETALIPLVARAQARVLFPDLGFVDNEAERVVATLGVRLDRFGAERTWQRGVVTRSIWFDDRCRRFLAANPEALVLELGAGLSMRYRRLKPARARWIDIDLPEMIAVKRGLVRQTRRYRLLPADITDGGWLDAIDWRPGTPVLVLAEGLLMYLAPGAVATLFRAMATHFRPGPGPVACLFDYVSPLLVANCGLHPALRYARARFRWGIAGADAVTGFDRRYAVVEDRDGTRDCGLAPAYVSLLYQMLTWGRFPYGFAQVRLRKR